MSIAPTVLMVFKQKGGVGGTTMTRAFSAYSISLKATAKIFDGEKSGRDLVQFETRAQVVDPSQPRDLMKVMDNLPPLTLLDIRAGEGFPTLATLRQVGFFDDVNAGSVHFGVAHVVGNSKSSMGEILEIQERGLLADGMRYWLLKNHISADGGFSEWESDPRYSTRLQALAPMTASIPHLVADAAETLQKRGGNFSDFVDDVQTSRVLRGFVRSWLSATFAQFDRIGVREFIASAVG